MIDNFFPLIVTFWGICVERNWRIFEDTEEDSDVICDRVKSWVVLWVHRDREFNNLFLSGMVRSWGLFL